DGGVDKLELHIPIEAKNSHLKRLENDIYRLGMGVDVSAEKLGNSSGVALKFIYSLLDLKADMSEIQFKKSIRHLLKIISNWLRISKGIVFDRKEVKVTFNRSMLVNTKEQIINVTSSVGMLSKETLLANHPFVTDVDYELTKMEEEGMSFPTAPLKSQAIDHKEEYENQDSDLPSSQNKING
ncbi:MAG: phage portal protein, partial [Clostridiales bacterium]|nr:phage portal protein [Clostridiales bacterium]